MDRRLLLGAVGAGLFGAFGTRALAGTDGLTPQAVADAWLAGLPLIEMAAARARMLDPGAVGQKAGLNAFHHTRQLIQPGDHAVTTPNNDTLFSSAFIDLSKGPARLSVPDASGRYLSVAVMDMYTNNTVVLSPRTPGGAAGDYLLATAGDKSRRGPRTLELPTSQGWVLCRTLVDGPEDMGAAHKVQDRLVLTGPAIEPYPRYATRADPPAAYFKSVAALLAQNPPHRGGELSAIDRLGSADPRVLEAGVALATDALKAERGRLPFRDGWQYPQPDLGDYGDDVLYRAFISVAGLGALTPPEAMYMRAAGDTGVGLFNGDGPFRLHLPEALPVNGFWSLTLYEATPEGQFFLSENPMRRYTIGDRTRGLRTTRGGGVDIWIGRHDPGGARTANWLPAPARGPWAVTLRAYLPKAELLSGRYRLPPLSAA